MNNKALLGLVIVVVILLGGYFAMSKSQSKSATQNETGPIKIGYVTPISGDAASLGEFLKNVTDLTVAEINKDGGVKGRPIQIIYEDDKCDPKLSVTATQKLIDADKVKMIIGSTCSGSVLSMLPVTDKAKVFLMSSSATSPDITGRSPLFVRNVPSDASQGSVLAEASIKNGFKKIAVIQENTTYAKGVFDAFKAVYTSDRGEIVNEEFLNTSDFRTVLVKLKMTSPDALMIIPASPTSAQRIISALSDIKWAPKILTIDMISGNAELVSKNSKSLEGAMVAEQGSDLTNQKYLDLEKNYQALYGKPMVYKSYSQAQYDLMYMLREGLRQFGEDPVKISAWMRTIKDWDGASGKLSLDQNGDRVGGYILKVVKDGKAVEVK